MTTVVYEGPDQVSAAMLNELVKLHGEYTDVSNKIAAASGDKEAAIAAWISTSDEPTAVKLRNAIETAQNKLRELALSNVTTAEISEEDLKKLEAHKSTLVDRIKVGTQTVKGVAATINKDIEGVTKALEALNASSPVSVSKRGRKPGFTGSTAPRTRVNVVMTSNEKPDDPKSFDSISKAASWLNTETSSLLGAFAKAAGVSVENVKTVDVPVSFEFQVPGHRQVWTVSTTPKPRKDAA